MTYTLQEQYTSKNQVPGSAADSVWHLGARKVSSITIHHWGLRGQQFGTVRDFLCTNNTPTSAHYVAQDGLVACIVSPDDCAFHAGNAQGNTNSIGIECRPEATDGDYATIAELIRYLRGIYGDVPLYPHNHWYNTACPGDYDLGRLDSLARGSGGSISVQGSIASPASSITPTTSLEDFMGGLIDAQQADDIVNAVVARVVAALDNNVRINAIQAESIVQATTARTAALVDANANGKTINAQQADDIAQAAANYNQAKDASLYNKDGK